MENIKKPFFLRVYQIYKPFKRHIITMLLFLIFGQIASLALPFFYGKIIDSLISQHWYLVILFVVGSFIFQVLFNAISEFRDRYEIKYLDQEINRYVAKLTLKKFLNFSIGQHHNQNSGVKQSIITRGEHSLAGLAYTLTYDIVPMAIQIVLTTVVLLSFNFILGLIIFFGVVVFIYITIIIDRRFRAELEKNQEMFQEVDKFQGEIMRNVDVVEINAKEDKVSDEFDKSLGGAGDYAKKIWRGYSFYYYLRDNIVNLSRFALIAAGAYMVFKGEITPGYLVMFLTWANNALGRLGNIGGLHRNYLNMKTAVQKYFDMMDIEPEVKLAENPIKINFNGEIEFKNVTFKYPSRKQAEDDNDVSNEEDFQFDTLNKVNFKIENGKKVAFVGYSGAGKSTIIHLLIRAYDPQKGKVLIDGIDLKDLDLNLYRESIGLVEQDVKLFDNSLRYNIEFGLLEDRKKISEKEFNKLAKLSRINQFFSRLEKGYDTIIGEKGVKLSGGERQRVGIARALVKNPKFLIFDEATSHLDAENEKAIQASIQEASKGRTTIIIAHRLSTIKDADKIFVLDKGKIVGEGIHEELMEKCKQYKNLVTHQVVAP